MESVLAWDSAIRMMPLTAPDTLGVVLVLVRSHIFRKSDAIVKFLGKYIIFVKKENDLRLCQQPVRDD